MNAHYGMRWIYSPAPSHLNLDEIETDPNAPTVGEIIDRNKPKKAKAPVKLSAEQSEKLDRIDQNVKRLTLIAERLNSPRPCDDPRQLRQALICECEELLHARKEIALQRNAAELREIREQQVELNALRLLIN